MPMRIDCKNYESRTYKSGETVRMCRLDLAPEAPWRCPAECPKFERRIGDAGWTFGSLAPIAQPPEPPRLDDDAIALLDEAEDIVNAIGADVLSEVRFDREAAAGRVPRWKRLLPKRKRR